MVRFFDNHIRFNFENGKLYIRVTGENHEPGVREALNRIAELEDYFSAQGTKFEAYKRKMNAPPIQIYKTDAIILKLEKTLEGALKDFAKAAEPFLVAANKKTPAQGGHYIT